MGASKHLLRPAERIRLDWTLIACGLVAGALLAGILIRIDSSGGDGAFGDGIGGLRALAENETLVAFEDYNHDAGGWDGRPVDLGQAGLGGVLGPVPLSEPVSRRFDLPENTSRAALSFDLIGLDDWETETLTVSIGDQQVLRHSLSSRPDLADNTISDLMQGDTISVMARSIDAPRERAYGSGTPSLYETVLRVRISIAALDTALVLNIAGSPPAGGSTTDPEPRWALDNLSLVAEVTP